MQKYAAQHGSGNRAYQQDSIMADFVLKVCEDANHVRISNLTDEQITMLEADHKIDNSLDEGVFLVDISRPHFGEVLNDGLTFCGEYNIITVKPALFEDRIP